MKTKLYVLSFSFFTFGLCADPTVTLPTQHRDSTAAGTLSSGSDINSKDENLKDGAALICEDVFKKSAALRYEFEKILRDITQEIPLKTLLTELGKSTNFKKYLKLTSEDRRAHNNGLLLAFTEVALTQNSNVTLDQIPLMKRNFEEQLALLELSPECTEAAIEDLSNSAQTEVTRLLEQVNDPQKKEEEVAALLSNWFLKTKEEISEAYLKKDYRKIELLKSELAMLEETTHEATLLQKINSLHEYMLLSSDTPLIDKLVLFSNAERGKLRAEKPQSEGSIIKL